MISTIEENCRCNSLGGVWEEKKKGAQMPCVLLNQNILVPPCPGGMQTPHVAQMPAAQMISLSIFNQLVSFCHVNGSEQCCQLSLWWSPLRCILLLVSAWCVPESGDIANIGDSSLLKRTCRKLVLKGSGKEQLYLRKVLRR